MNNGEAFNTAYNKERVFILVCINDIKQKRYDDCIRKCKNNIDKMRNQKVLKYSDDYYIRLMNRKGLIGICYTKMKDYDKAIKIYDDILLLLRKLTRTNYIGYETYHSEILCKMAKISALNGDIAKACLYIRDAKYFDDNEQVQEIYDKLYRASTINPNLK